jgi:cell division protein FtsL
MEEEIAKLEKQVEDLEEENKDLRIKVTDMTNAFENIIYEAKQQL